MQVRDSLCKLRSDVFHQLLHEVALPQEKILFKKREGNNAVSRKRWKDPSAGICHSPALSFGSVAAAYTCPA